MTSNSKDKKPSIDYHTPAGLRQALAENLAGLRSKEITPDMANATANSVGKVMQTYKLQIDYAKHTGTTAHLPELQTSVPS